MTSIPACQAIGLTGASRPDHDAVVLETGGVLGRGRHRIGSRGPSRRSWPRRCHRPVACPALAAEVTSAEITEVCLILDGPQAGPALPRCTVMITTDQVCCPTIPSTTSSVGPVGTPRTATSVRAPKMPSGSSRALWTLSRYCRERTVAVAIGCCPAEERARRAGSPRWWWPRTPPGMSGRPAPPGDGVC